MSVRFRRPRSTSIRPALTPLIDVVFQLLIFFMLTTQFVQPALRIALPTGSSSATVKQQQIILRLSQSGALHLGSRPVHLHNLEAHLKEMIARSSNNSVFFYGDANARYKQIFQIMEIVNRSGAQAIHFVHSSDEL